MTAPSRANLRRICRALSFRRAWRQVRRDLRRTSSCVAAIALGVAAVVALRLMNGAVLTAFVAAAGALGRIDFSVVAANGANFPDDIAGPIAALSGVARVVPVIRGTAFLDDGSGEALVVHAFDLTDRDAAALYDGGDAAPVVDDELAFLNRTDAVLVGRAFADRRGLGKHDQLDVVTPAGVRRFTIEGLIGNGGLGTALDGRILVMDRYAAEQAFAGRDLVTQLDVVLVERDGAAAARAAVERILPAGLQVRDVTERQDTVRRGVRGFEGLLFCFGCLVLLAGFVVCFGRLNTVLATRAWEAGVLRAIGMSERAVALELLKEAALVGALGSAVGCGLGLAVARRAVPAVITAMALNYRWPVPVTAAVLDPAAAVPGVLVGMVAAATGALAPVVRLAATPPMTALRLGRRPPPPVPRRRRRWLGALLVAAACLLAAELRWRGSLLGIAMTGEVMLAAALSAPGAVAWAGRLLASVPGHRLGALVRIVAVRLRARPLAAGATAATIAIGVGAMVLVAVLARSFEGTVVARATASVRADLVVSSALAGAGYRFAPVSDALLGDLAAIAGVERVGGTQSTDVDFRGARVTLKAYDEPLLHDGRLFRWPLAPGAAPAALDRVEGGDGALVSTAFADMFGVGVGDTVELASPAGMIRFGVVGVALGQPETAVVVARDRYRRVWNDRDVCLAYVAVTPGVPTATVAAAIARTLGTKYRLEVRTGPALVAYLGREVRRGFALFYVVAALTLVLVMVAIGDAMAGTVTDRHRELGVLRAVGVTGRALFSMTVLEAVVVAAAGLAVATVAGLLLGVFWVHVEFPALLGWRLDLGVPWRVVGGAVGGTIVACVAATAWASLRAARVSATAALLRAG